MSFDDTLPAADGDPAAYEQLYRTAQADGREQAFREALQRRLEEQPHDVLLRAWAHRLALPLPTPEEAKAFGRHGWKVVAGSVVLGLISAWLAGGKPPVPDPAEADVRFWIGWGPLVALGLLAYLAWGARSSHARKRYGVAAVAVGALALAAGLVFGGRTDDVAVLAALHLPFVAWAVVGAALCLGHPDPARQAYAFLVKSVEVVLTGGIFFGAGLVFVGLTLGIFAVLGVQIPEEDLVVVAGWAVGAVPLLALAAVYDARTSPLGQDAQAGLARTLRILARLLLPLALGVLLVYVLWFIPAYFFKAFEERDVLIVYNATILALLVLLTVVVSGPVEARAGGRHTALRAAVLVLGGLTLVLNAYALAAVVSRALDAGWTPNRLAVAGWNLATLLLLANVGVRLWRQRGMPWQPALREALGRYAMLVGVWALGLLIVLPLLF